MTTRDDLISALNLIFGHGLLKKVQTMDRSANGIQVQGAPKVTKVALGVSINLEFLQKAHSWGAEFVIAHHGLNLSDKYVYNARLDRAAQARLKFIFQHGLTVASYHAALDVHPQIGNNAQIIKRLGSTPTGESYFQDWGWIGEFDRPVLATKLKDVCQNLFGHDVFAVTSGPKKIKRLGVCSGAAKPVGETLFELYDANIDLHLSGEISEGLDHIASESGFNYFACGHYATETLGVQALGKKLQQQFGSQLQAKFIDVPSIL